MGLLDYLREQLNPPSSVMDRKYIGQTPQWKPEYEQEPALQAPTISPDDLIGTGIPTKIAGLLGGVGKGLLATPMVAGTFIGKSAKSWNAEAAKRAEGLLASGADPRKVWKETGTFKGPDGFLRQEIPDNIAPTKMDATVENLFFTPNLSEFISHKPLYSAYPETQYIQVKNGKMGGNGAGGSFFNKQHGGAEITIDAPYFNNKTLETNRASTSTAMHELQHYIQDKEGWAKGGLPEDMRDEALNMLRRDVASGEIADTAQAMDMLPMAQMNAYRRLAGEAEARATQARMNMNMADRLNTYPLDSYDVPVDQLIIRGLLGN